jgi:UDP-N-acetylglucosamine 1-carboxyvinyltransferase
MTKGTETRYRVRGAAPLQGTVFIQGAKNAALKMIAAALLTDKGRTVLRNVPPIEDVRRAVELSQAIGAKVEFHEAERTLVVDASSLTSPVLPAEIARRFRGSVLFVPALLHRFGEAVIEGIGGCNLGDRNLDFHYRGFARLGATVDEGESVIRITAPGGLRGAHLYLDTPSHTGTENLMMAASLAPGTTIIDNTAQEPEVLDMISFLTKMGAEVTGGGTGFITVHGVSELQAVEHTVMSDRIDAGVFAMAAAATGGEINLVGANLDHLGVVRWKLEQMGVEFSSNGAVLQVRRERPVRPINVITSPFPGFATDLQSPIMAVATLADGASYIRETIFDSRYTLVPELNKMGAKVEIDNNVAIVHGPTALRGCDVVAHDLRGGAALILAGLAAEGETVVSGGYLIDRGHATFAERLRALGADVTAEEHEAVLAPGGRPPIWGYARWGKACATASNASFAAGVPIEILAPSPGYARTAMPTASHACAKAVVWSPRGSQTKFASVTGTVQPSAMSVWRTRSRSFTTVSTRSRSSSSAPREATAAACAIELTVNGSMVLRTASATGSWPIRKPTRRPARPYALEKVRSTATLGRSR